MTAPNDVSPAECQGSVSAEGARDMLRLSLVFNIPGRWLLQTGGARMRQDERRPPSTGV
jgi:hypothetical protein